MKLHCTIVCLVVCCAVANSQNSVRNTTGPCECEFKHYVSTSLLNTGLYRHCTMKYQSERNKLQCDCKLCNLTMNAVCDCNDLQWIFTDRDICDVNNCKHCLFDSEFAVFDIPNLSGYRGERRKARCKSRCHEVNLVCGDDYRWNYDSEQRCPLRNTTDLGKCESEPHVHPFFITGLYHRCKMETPGRNKMQCDCKLYNLTMKAECDCNDLLWKFTDVKNCQHCLFDPEFAVFDIPNLSGYRGELRKARCKSRCNEVELICGDNYRWNYASTEQRCPQESNNSTINLVLVVAVSALTLFLCGVWNWRLRKRTNKIFPATTDRHTTVNALVSRPIQPEYLEIIAEKVTLGRVNETQLSLVSPAQHLEPIYALLPTDQAEDNAGYIEPVRTISEATLTNGHMESNSGYLEPIKVEASALLPASDCQEDRERGIPANVASAPMPIPICAGEPGSPYADILNLENNQFVAEYEYIMHNGRKI